MLQKDPIQSFDVKGVWYDITKKNSKRIPFPPFNNWHVTISVSILWFIELDTNGSNVFFLKKGGANACVTG